MDSGYKKTGYLIIPAFYGAYFYLSDKFTYQSQLFSYLFILFSFGFSSYLFVRLFFRKSDLRVGFTLQDILALLLWFMPVITVLVIKQYEIYFLIYYLSVFLLFLTLSLYNKSFSIPKDIINHIIIAFSVCECGICLLQYLDILKAGGNFPVSGLSNNPNVTSMFLVMALPVYLIEFNNTKKLIGKLFILLLCLSVLFTIVFLQSRSAYIGAGVIIICGVLYNAINLKGIKRYITFCIIGFVIIGGILLFPKLYSFKEDSANGRLFVWKVSAHMIADKPLSGYGYGMIQGEYNRAQADFFRHQNTTEVEKRNADYIYNLMNDYLEMSVQGGVFGGLLYIFFITGILFWGIRLRHSLFYAFTGVLAFAIMGLTNFAFYCPQVVILFIYYASLINSESKSLYCVAIKEIKKVSLISIPCMVLLATAIIQFYSQIQLKKVSNCIKAGQYTQAKDIIDNKVYLIHNTDLYNRLNAIICDKSGQINEAIAYYDKALKFSYHPTTLMHKANNEFINKNYEGAEQDLLHASFIKPVLFEPLYALMYTYSKLERWNDSKNMAQIIVDKEVKIDSDKINYYKKQARKILN